MTIKSVTIIGAGTMGGGIALGCLTAGLKTCVVDLSESSLSSLKLRCDKYFNRLIEKEKITAADRTAAMALMSYSTNLSDAAQADLVIEAVFEDLQTKRAVFSKLADHLPETTIVATNTSALRVADLATSLPRPERFLGLHYFSPAEVNPLVEVISGPETSGEALLAARGFLENTKKIALLCNDNNGFAVNRFFCPYSNEAVRLLDDGAGTTGQIDAVARETFDLAMGPFAVMNIIKPRINLNSVSNLSGLGALYEPAAGLRAIGQTEDSWQIEDTPTQLSPEAKAIVVGRLQAAVFLPILEAIEEGVAEPDDFDLGARMALRFGQPPVAMMKEIGKPEVTSIITPMAQQYGCKIPEHGLEKLFN